MSQVQKPTPLEDDPALFSEAQRIARVNNEPEMRQRRALLDRFGSFFLLPIAVKLPFGFWPDDRDVISLDEINTASKMELWALEKAAWSKLTIWYWCILLALTLAYCAQTMRFRHGENANKTTWPSIKYILVSAIIFGATITLPGLASTYLAPPLWIPGTTSFLWILFLKIWSLLAAAFGLLIWLRKTHGLPRLYSRTVTVSQPGVREYSILNKWGVGLVFIGALVTAYYAFIQYPGNRDLYFTVLVLFFLLLGILAIIAGVWMGGMLRQREECCLPSPAAKHLLVAFAGGFLLWTMSFFVIDWQERAWMKKDTLFAHQKKNEIHSYYPLEVRTVHLYREHMNNVLKQYP